MAKPRLGPDQYLDMLNAELRKHEYFQQGMGFLPFPEGTHGADMSGYSVTGPYALMGVYAEAAHKVSANFDLLV